MCIKAVWKSVDGIKNDFYSARLSFLFCYSVILVMGLSFNCLFIQQTFGCLLCIQFWAGHWGHRENLDRYCYSRLVGDRMDIHLRTVRGIHAMMKEKPRGRVGAHRGGQSSLRSDEGFLRNQFLGVSQMERRKGHRRENSVCRAQWYEAVLSVSVNRANALAGSSLVALSLDLVGCPFLAQRHPLVTPSTPTPDSCPALRTLRNLWLESLGDAPLGRCLQDLDQASRVLLGASC